MISDPRSFSPGGSTWGFVLHMPHNVPTYFYAQPYYDLVGSLRPNDSLSIACSALPKLFFLERFRPASFDEILMNFFAGHLTQFIASIFAGLFLVTGRRGNALDQRQFRDACGSSRQLQLVCSWILGNHRLDRCRPRGNVRLTRKRNVRAKWCCVCRSGRCAVAGPHGVQHQ